VKRTGEVIHANETEDKVGEGEKGGCEGARVRGSKGGAVGFETNKQILNTVNVKVMLHCLILQIQIQIY